jgi:membrane protease YdiL (CAAX protease family)
LDFLPKVSNVLQALIFASWHLGVSYTPASLIFIVFLIFPLGLLLGHLMRATNGIVTPASLHAGFAIPIYLAFLTYVA